MKKNKKIGLNIILNIMKNIMSIIFPLITLPYVCRVLGVVNIGKINYASSIISYFILISGLGIPSYAIREGSKKCDNRAEISDFASQIISFNIVSTIIAYIGILIIMMLSETLKFNNSILLILSVQIVFITMGMDWINTIYEEFMYLTIRYLIIQIISIVLLFTLVKTENDYIIYAMIIVFSGVGANIFNFFYIRRFCSIKIVGFNEWKCHIKPVMYIFFACIASSVYTSLDTTMLGIIKGDYEVGIYSVAIKVYKILKQLMFAIIIVFEPRLSFLARDIENGAYQGLLNRIFNLMILLLPPICIGLVLTSFEIIKILVGPEYVSAVIPLQVLSVSIVFTTLAYLVIHGAMLPLGKEKYLGSATIVGAVVNFVFNYIFIKRWGCVGVAVGTLLAEAAVMIVSYWIIKDDIKIIINKRYIRDVTLGCLGIISIWALTLKLNYSVIYRLIFQVIGGGSIYIIILLICDNYEVKSIYKNVLNRIMPKTL